MKPLKSSLMNRKSLSLQVNLLSSIEMTSAWAAALLKNEFDN
ncbi:exported hypothetical protein [Vibrio nigripulchritudo SO65]|nr:exported hypothetical protein [Vibrio nigripulchritudo AM115]CCN41555.1 exported hypothetical protein [Vibrio nigripulchritudo FTn2]CCN64232.1 exported hypothetical protein [Vibrio nigripulchritudo POn4]CCN75702.1 exported hypothetical protein [Vibrio nigripulchritudo SO65]